MKASTQTSGVGDDRLICTVTEDDNEPTPTGHLLSAIQTENLWHRTSFVVVRCSGDDIDDSEEYVYLLQKAAESPPSSSSNEAGIIDHTPSNSSSSLSLIHDMVNFGEAYSQAAERLIRQYFANVPSIVVSASPPNDENQASLQRQFRFRHEDATTKVWGQVYECYCDTVTIQSFQYNDSSSTTTNLKRISITELKQNIANSTSNTIHNHVIKLYLQRVQDKKANRRLLKGYSSSDLDSYTIRPKPKVIFFDCDDTLYFDHWKTANQLTSKINDWCMSDKINLPDGAAYDLYKKYGTALKGLLAEQRLENTEEAIDEFLRQVHDIPIRDLIPSDPKLRSMLSLMDPSIPRYIFTASVSHHAQRCIEALGIEDMFEPTIIDVKACNLETKHSVLSFQAAMKIANVSNPEECLFLDDSVKNIHAARQLGWRCILVGRVGRDCGTSITTEHAELEIDRIHDLSDVFPELFTNEEGGGGGGEVDESKQNVAM